MRTIAYDGEIRINTKIDSSGISSGVNKIKSAFGSIVSSLSVFSLMQQGVDMVTGSIDAALDRGDTMDQFDRTMNKLVGDSAKVDKALNDLKGTTTGTAYSLDTAAKATQNFVTRGMDLGDATNQVSIWAEAVAFYGKGTNEEFANVTDALGKMLTKGRVDMDQLDRLFDVGIDAVGMYAQAVGRSSAEVQDDLSYGRISAEDFVTTVSNAMETGAGGVQKIAGAAKEAGASWSGTISNMRTAVTRGVLGIIESLDEGLQAANLPGIKEMISGIGSTIEDVLGKASGMIPNFIQAATGLYDEFQPVISSLGDVISGVIDTVQQKLPEIISAGKELYNAVAPDLKNLVTTIGDLLGGAIKTVIDMLPGAIRTVTSLYNTIKPLAPLILGVTAAVKGWQAFRTAQTWLGGVGKTLTDTAKKILDFTGQGKGLVSILNQAGTSATNASKLFTTAGKVTKNMSGEISAASKVTGVLSKALSFLTSPLGLVISACGLAAGAVGYLAYQGDLTNQVNRELKESQEKVNEAMEQAAQANQDAIDSASEAQTAHEQSLTTYQDLYDELMTLVDANGKVKEGYEDRVDYINGELNSAFGTNLQCIEGEVQGLDDLKSQWDDLIEKQRAYYALEDYQTIRDTAEDNMDNYGNQISDLLNQIEAAQAEIDSAKAALEGPIYGRTEDERNDYIERFNNTISENQRKIESLRQQLTSLNQQYSAEAGKVDLYEQAQEAYTTGDYGSVTKLTNQMATLQTYTADAGATLDELKEQAQQAATGLRDAAYALSLTPDSQSAIDAYELALENALNATQEYAEKTGKAVDGIIIGFDSRGEAIFGSAQMLMMQATHGIDSIQYKAAEAAYNAGIELSDSMIESIDSKSDEVQASAISVLERLGTAAEDQKPELYALLYSLGVEFDDNLKSGLTDNIHVVTEAGSDVITGFTDGAGNQITEVTPEFCQMLVGLGIAGKDQMDAYMRTHNIQAPSMENLSVEQQAANAVQRVQNYLNSHPVTIKYNQIGSAIGSLGSLAVSQHADGGLITKPHLGIVGEDGPEAIIPLSPSRRSRALELWQQAGQWLGVKLHAAGAIVSRMQPVSYPPIVRNAEAQAQRMILQTQLNTDAIRQACKEGCESAVLAVAVENRVQAVFNPKTAAREMADYTDSILGDKTRRVKRYAE